MSECLTDQIEIERSYCYYREGRSSHGDFPSVDWVVDDSYRGIFACPA